jgi:hypothetical protein
LENIKLFNKKCEPWKHCRCEQCGFPWSMAIGSGLHMTFDTCLDLLVHTHCQKLNLKWFLFANAMLGNYRNFKNLFGP